MLIIRTAGVVLTNAHISRWCRNACLFGRYMSRTVWFQRRPRPGMTGMPSDRQAAVLKPELLASQLPTHLWCTRNCRRDEKRMAAFPRIVWPLNQAKFQCGTIVSVSFFLSFVPTCGCCQPCVEQPIDHSYEPFLTLIIVAARFPYDSRQNLPSSRSIRRLCGEAFSPATQPLVEELHC